MSATTIAQSSLTLLVLNRAFKREFGMPPAGWRKKRSKVDVASAPMNAMQPARETTANA